LPYYKKKLLELTAIDKAEKDEASNSQIANLAFDRTLVEGEE